MKDKKTYGFDNESVDRIRKTVATVERAYVNDAPGRARWPAPGFTGLLPAKNGGSVVAGGSLATPTSFTCTLLVPTGTTGALTTTDGQSVEALNAYAGTIAANKLIWLAPFANQLYVAAADCP